MIALLLHADQTLDQLVRDYGTAVHAILFAIVFAETGFVVTPFLPGDSLLFATGALCARGSLSTPVALAALATAAFAGNAVNYAVGRIVVIGRRRRRPLRSGTTRDRREDVSRQRHH